MYIIIWHPDQRNVFIHKDDHGFMASYGSEEDAKEEAKECKDGEDFTHYKIAQL